MTFSAQKLRGSCISNVRSGTGTGSMSCHILGCSIALCSSTDIAGGCSTRGGAQPPPPETYPIPNKGATFYGKNQQQFDMPDNYYFDLLDIMMWDEVVDQYYSNITAPRFQNHTTYMRLVERDQKNHPFENMNDVSWTEASTTIYPNDWLGNLMPGGWCYVSKGIPEPMLGESFYEDAAKEIDRPYLLNKTNSSVRENWTPLCYPIKVYNSSGTQIGSFDGLSYSVFFNAAAVKMPLQKREYDPATQTFTGSHPNGMLPRDVTLTTLLGEPPYLNAQRQILSLEVWVYLSSSNGATIKSPRIGTCRWWHYTKGIEYLDGGNYNSPFNPYMFLNTELTPGFLDVPIKFKLLKNGSNPRNLDDKISNMRVQSFRLFLGA